MDKKDYFNNLKTLYEAIGMAGTNEVVPQEQIADSGSDVMPGTQPVQEPQVEGENPMMVNELPIQQETLPPNNALVMEKQKFLKIFNNMRNMLEYGETFLESIKCIDINLLDLETYNNVVTYTQDIENLLEKIREYLSKIFTSETYEAVLHAHILFRTEFIICIKGLRQVLKLDQVDYEEKNEE